MNALSGRLAQLVSAPDLHSGGLQVQVLYRPFKFREAKFTPRDTLKINLGLNEEL